MLSHKVLSDLQIMSNFEMDSRDLAVILLVGQPRLNTTLNQSTHESLRQRIVMNYHMGGITKEEGRRYITRKLEGAGSRQTVFDSNAVEAVLNAANGTPPYDQQDLQPQPDDRCQPEPGHHRCRYCKKSS